MQKKIIAYFYHWSILASFISWYLFCITSLEEYKRTFYRLYSGRNWTDHLIFYIFIFTYAFLIFKIHRDGKFRWHTVLEESWRDLVQQEPCRFQTVRSKNDLEIDVSKPKSATLIGITLLLIFFVPLLLLAYLIVKNTTAKGIWGGYLILLILPFFLGRVIRKGVRVSRKHSVGFFLALRALTERKSCNTEIVDDPSLKFFGRITDAIPGFVYLLICVGVGFILFSDFCLDFFRADVNSWSEIYSLKMVLSAFGLWSWNRSIKSLFRKDLKES